MKKIKKSEYSKILKKRKRKVELRLRRKSWEDQPKPMFTAKNISYEISDKVQAINCGGIGAIHKMVDKIGLTKEIDDNLELLKVHLPYHESDHILNMSYNILAGNKRLEDLEMLRNDETYMNALGAHRIPDPTTAGDFTRRFKEDDIKTTMDCINNIRKKVWKESGGDLLKEAFVDVDGTIAPTGGECKAGMDISYKGIWGYAPLIITLANTKEVLYLVNRPGNRPSHDGAAEWIDRAIDLVTPFAERTTFRGDTDFSLTANFDRWDEKVDFLFGMDACSAFVARAVELPEQAWDDLERKPKYEVKTKERKKPHNVKEQIVREREFKNIKLKSEQVAEFDYSPSKCKKTYRMVVVRKNLSIEKGENVLFDDIRYFFYITTRRDLTKAQVVRLANERCDQENVIEQLKNGVNAMRIPVRDLLSNWAYVVIATLAWNLKAWFGLLIINRERGLQVIKMEFRRFLNSFILLPTQIIRTGRQIKFRILGYNEWLCDFMAVWDRIRQLKLA